MGWRVALRSGRVHKLCQRLRSSGSRYARHRSHIRQLRRARTIRHGPGRASGRANWCGDGPSRPRPTRGRHAAASCARVVCTGIDNPGSNVFPASRPVWQWGGTRYNFYLALRLMSRLAHHVPRTPAAEVRRVYRKPQGYDTAVVLHRASRPRCAQAHSLLWETPHDQVSCVCRRRQVGSKVLRRASRRRIRSSLDHVVLPARARGRAQLTHVGTRRRPLARMGDGEWRVNIYMALRLMRRLMMATHLFRVRAAGLCQSAGHPLARPWLLC